MQKDLFDSRITYQNKLQFNKQGWTLVDLHLDEDLINNTIIGLKKMRNKSIQENFKAKRIYYDHLFSNNLAAIELPFNKKICNENIKNFFKEAKIGSLVRTIMDWEVTCCDLSRLFCMGNYNYRGNWHRDYESDLDKIHQDSKTRNTVLVGIYFLPQNGFRILKKEYEFNGVNSVVKNKNIDKEIRAFPFPLSPPRESYQVINGKAGTALIFDPLLLHQGSNFSNRFDFHMKFTNSKISNPKINDFQDFSVINILHENYELPSNKNNSSDDSGLAMIPFTKRSPYYERLLNTIDYRFLIRRILKIKSLKDNNAYQLLKSEGWEIDLFSNTFLQK